VSFGDQGEALLFATGCHQLRPAPQTLHGSAAHSPDGYARFSKFRAFSSYRGALRKSCGSRADAMSFRAPAGLI